MSLDVPGLAEALRWEAEARAEAFLDLPLELCGVTVLPLTLRREALLLAAGNVFFTGGKVTAKDVVDFLWFLSPGLRVGDPEAYTAFCIEALNRAAVADLDAAKDAIGDFLDRAYLDAPAGSGGATVPITSSEASYCEVFAEAFGWSIEYTMNLRLERLFQVLRRLTLRRNPQAQFINRRSDKVRGEFLRSLRAA